MASEEPPKKLRIVNRLDFENCVFSGLKTGSKRKKRLRARYYKDVESFEKNLEAENVNYSLPFESPLKTYSVVQEETSPVLLTAKSQKNKFAYRCNAGKSSPVFRSKSKFLTSFKSKRKIDFESQSLETSTNLDAPKSPIFKNSKFITRKLLKTPAETKIQENSRNFLKHLVNPTVISQEMKSFESEKFEENSYRIEESSQESKQSLHISSASSTEMKIPNSQMCPPDVQSDNEMVININENNEKSDISRRDSSPNSRKNFKKNVLIARLHTILKKQNSERLLWRFQSKKKLYDLEKLCLLSFWASDSNFVLKCVSSSSQSEIKYLVIDKEMIPNIYTLKKGSLLHLYPPWLQIYLGEEKVKVLINIGFLEVLKEALDHVLVEKKTFETISPKQFEGCEDDLLNKAFFSSNVSPFLL